MENKPITTDGEIISVMETWPLQLVVQSSQGRYDVRLLQETRVIRHDSEVGPGELRPGMAVEITGQAQGRAAVAELIRIK